MPSSTHYYLNFLVLQWVTHAMNMTRYVQAGANPLTPHFLAGDEVCGLLKDLERG